MNSQFIKAIHIFGRFHHPVDVLRRDFSTRFFQRKNKVTARSSATGDLFEVNGGLSRRLRDLSTGIDLIFEKGSNFIQYIELNATLRSNTLKTLPEIGRVFRFPTAPPLPKSAHSPIFQDTALWNLIQLDFLREECGSWRPIGSQQEQKLLAKVSARRACRASFFDLLPIFPKCISKGAKKKQVFRLYAFGKGKHFTTVLFKPKYQLWK